MIKVELIKEINGSSEVICESIEGSDYKELVRAYISDLDYRLIYVPNIKRISYCDILPTPILKPVKEVNEASRTIYIILFFAVVYFIFLAIIANNAGSKSDANNTYRRDSVGYPLK